jgi:glycosyltransferase involved in cell wall biosynthesis
MNSRNQNIGSVVSIFVAAEAELPMQPLDVAHLEEGRGVVGDRYYAGKGTFSEKLKGSPDSEVTLIESEKIDDFNSLHGLDLDYGSPRRNIVTRGVDLNQLVDVQFQVGEVLLEGIRLCEPCAHLANILTEKVLPDLVHRAGLRARIVSDGSIKSGDSISVPRTDQSPLVTIGMPIYNEERFLAQTLEMLCQQDYENFQILISDNASTDSTGDIAARIASADDRIQYLRVEENTGAVDNFRRVLDMAEGKYFMWAAGHDEWSKDLISDSVATLEANDGASIAFATSYWIDESGERDNRDTDYSDTRGKSLFSRFFTVFWGNMHPILGVIRLENLRRARSFRRFAGADLVLLSELILMGDFVHAPNASWNRRDVRKKENHSERMKRYTDKESGITNTPLDRRFPLLKLPIALIGTVWNAKIPWLQRLVLLLALLPMLPVRYVIGRRKANKIARG